MSTLSNNCYAQHPFLRGEALLSINTAGHGHLVKMLINLEPHGIFGSKFAYLIILKLHSL